MIKTKNLKQNVMIKASAAEIYEAFMDSKKHAKFSDSPASISRKVGGKFTAYDNYITGTNLELIKNKKIIQSWRASDWPERYFSTVTFLLKPTKGGTKLMFSQKGIPEDDVKNIAKGWKDFYWDPIKEMLEN